MFTTGHFIWLGAIALLIAFFMIVTKKFRVSQKIVQKTVFYLLIVLKLFHVSLSMKESIDGGLVIDQTQLSFHLCSLMIYSVFLINIVKNEKFVKTPVLSSYITHYITVGLKLTFFVIATV